MNANRRAMATIALAALTACTHLRSPGMPTSGPLRMEIQRGDALASVPGPTDRFTGVVAVTQLFGSRDDTHTSGGRVAFAPGGRSAWHTHPAGQTLIITSGTGWVAQWGGPKQQVRAGDVVWTPPGVKHWHGATESEAMTHIAIQELVDGSGVAWMEQVSDDEYRREPQTPSEERDTMSETKPPSPLRASLGELAPKLVELTEGVLFGDVWERPDLSKRDRSLITCAALVALGKTEQMDFHFPNAVKNGVTEHELVEMITHLAFYAGWPNAMSAANRAKAIFTGKQEP